jgi:tetratricopeptide (TPR) repeat protein
MVKSLVERQMRFRAKRKAQGGIRLDIWLPDEEAAKLKKLIDWRGQKAPKVVLGLINEWWRGEVEKAASNGHADAQFKYATMCAIEDEDSEAQRWFSKSAEQGYRVSDCYNNLGVLSLASGDRKAAKEWFQESAAQGGCVASYNLGAGALYVGLDGERDPRQAAEWFLKSADQGVNYAKLLLGVLYALGKGVQQDFDKATEWLRRALGEVDVESWECYLAHWLSTYPIDEHGLRDGHSAIHIAERLIKSMPLNYIIFERVKVQAEAYAEAGRFKDAIEIQKGLISKLKQTRKWKDRNSDLQDCKKRLNSYIDKKPWRDDSLGGGFLFILDPDNLAGGNGINNPALPEYRRYIFR